MAEFRLADDISDILGIFSNIKYERVYCSNCESTNVKLIGEKIVECNVCKACKAI